MPLGIDPKVDFAFKLVFGSPEHTRVTIHFLNSVLAWKQPIEQVEILNPILGKDRSEDKLVVLDVLAKDTAGRRFNIEMQTSNPIDLPKRLTFYNCLNYVGQLEDGDAYFDLRPAISICVLSRTLFSGVDDYHMSFRLRSDQADLVFCDGLEFHTLELSKFADRDHNEPSFGPLEKWLYFLLHAERMDVEELASILGEAEYREAAGVLEMISRTPEERRFYDARTKFLHDAEGRLRAARQEGIAEGLEQGLERGLEQGLERGLEQGLERGLEQGLERGIQQGLHTGITKGSLAGKIQVLQSLLGEVETPLDELLKSDEVALSTMLTELKQRMQSQSD